MKIEAIKLQPDQPFTWASGLQSPIYCDNRMVLGYHDERSEIIKAMADMCGKWGEVDLIAGVATAGIAHGALIADRLQLPFAYVRSSAKSHGRKNLIEGSVSKGQKAVVIEDLISTGGSSVKAVEALREEGIEVVGVLAIFSYEFSKADDRFKEINCPFTTLSNYSALIAAVSESDYFTAEQIASLEDWKNDPQGWSDRKV